MLGIYLSLCILNTHNLAQIVISIWGATLLSLCLDKVYK